MQTLNAKSYQTLAALFLAKDFRMEGIDDGDLGLLLQAVIQHDIRTQPEEVGFKGLWDPIGRSCLPPGHTPA
jgi:hypothetical protein